MVEGQGFKPLPSVAVDQFDGVGSIATHRNVEVRTPLRIHKRLILALQQLALFQQLTGDHFCCFTEEEADFFVLETAFGGGG